MENKKITYQDVLEASSQTELNEHSLTRVYQHFINSKATSFAILTAWDAGEKDKEKNKSNFYDLVQIIKSAKLGYFHIHGHWTDMRTGDHFVEPSVFVSGISLSLATKIMEKFSQQAILYSGEETSGNPTMFYANGGTKTVGKFSPGKIAKAYSELKKGRTFVFEGMPHGFFEGMMMQIHEKEHGERKILEMAE